MSNYLIKEGSLVFIADSVRSLIDADDRMTPETMANMTTQVAREIDTQTDLINQIIAAIDEKFGTGATLITFTIDGTSYQAEDGMTWAEWVESDYNTNESVTIGTFGEVLVGGGIITASGGALIGSTDTIIANASYVKSGQTPIG